MSSTAGDGCSKRIKLLERSRTRFEGGGKKKQNKRPHFDFLKKPWCEKFSSWGIGGIKQGREESKFQDRMTQGASSRVCIYNLHLSVNSCTHINKNPKIHFNDETPAQTPLNTQQGGK
jgi:hypothetical protein